MPTYEYRCENCSKTFTVQMGMTQHDQGGIRCPNCQATSISPQFSSFFAKTSKKS